MRIPAEAREIIREHTPALPTEIVPLTEAAGRYLAEDVVATEPYPTFPASTMDGFAVLASDPSPWREILGTQNAGDLIDASVSEGYAIRIMTGAPLPAGADAVVPLEATELSDGHVVIHQETIRSGDNLRPIGADIAEGDVVLTRGTRLTAPHVGLLASMGRVEIPVSRKVSISIISTGDELTEPNEVPHPGQIRDANRFSLRSWLADEPVDFTFIGKAPDDPEALHALMTERLEHDDIVITSGGVSMGEKDYIKALLMDDPDITVHFRRLYMKPGKPLNFATRGSTLFFGLPGNPVSCLVCCELFVRTTIRLMSGATEIDRPIVKARLDANASPSDRIEYQRATVTVSVEGQLRAVSNGEQRSSRLQSFVGANALVVIPPGESRLPAGTVVDALLLAPPIAGNGDGL